jgi:hypothetical protein
LGKRIEHELVETDIDPHRTVEQAILDGASEGEIDR